MDTNKTIKELVKAGFTEEQAVLLTLRFITKEVPQRYSSEDTTLKIGELKLWLIDKFGELKIDQQSISIDCKYMRYIQYAIFIIFGVAVWTIVYLKTRI